MNGLQLLIESSTTACSVALARDGRLIDERFENQGYAHDTWMAPAVQQLLNEHAVAMHHIESVAVSSGPGSYTGLRIGVSFAKGFCWALNIPLIAVDSLELMAIGIRKLYPGYQYYMPMIDARRNEVYTTLMDAHGHCLKPSQAIVLDGIPWQPEQPNSKIAIAGVNVDKVVPFISAHTAYNYLGAFFPKASYMVSLAQRKYQAKAFENLGDFEPVYVKSFQEVTIKHQL